MKREKDKIIADFGQEYYDMMLSKVEAPLKDFTVFYVKPSGDTEKFIIHAHYFEHKDTLLEFHKYTGDILSDGRIMWEKIPTERIYVFERDKVVCVKSE